VSPAVRSPDREPVVRGWIPIAFSVLSMAFAVGVAYASSTATAAETERLRLRLDAHVTSDTSAVLAEQVRAVRGDTTTLDADLRAMREAIERIDRNLAVVCASTPRAQCAR